MGNISGGQNNYLLAKKEADTIDDEIMSTLESGASFVVEAGAGSGKTYSLIKVSEWIQENKQIDFSKKHQKAICITFTNRAVEVIKGRLRDDSIVEPSTIHSFCWNAIKQYQSVLIKLFMDNFESSDIKERDSKQVIREVVYDLGYRYFDDGIQHIYHDDVIRLFLEMMQYPKFCRIFASKYPIILIDEYQDTSRAVMECFYEKFISKARGTQFVFFGDAWQTIYDTNKSCGGFNFEIKRIGKRSNFRSAPNIVKFLNKLRPDLPQISAINEYDGEIFVITSDDYNGKRRERYFKNDLPVEELKKRIDKLQKCIEDSSDPYESTKTLMITHKVLAAQQGYSKLLDILGDKLSNDEDCIFSFFMYTVEPAFKALQKKDTLQLYEILKIRRYPIHTKSEKVEWGALLIKLEDARKKSASEVLTVISETGLIPLPPKVDEWINILREDPQKIYSESPQTNVTINDYLSINYSQFIAAINFRLPETCFSTNHGVKGEEFENVIFVISRGWNNYQFGKYIPLLAENRHPPDGEKERKAFERNRNLFYVCCSRPKKRLFIFASIPLEKDFRSFLEQAVGKDNIVTYSEFISKYPRELTYRPV